MYSSNATCSSGTVAYESLSLQGIPAVKLLDLRYNSKAAYARFRLGRDQGLPVVYCHMQIIDSSKRPGPVCPCHGWQLEFNTRSAHDSSSDTIMSTSVGDGESYPGDSLSISQLLGAAKRKLRGSTLGGRCVLDRGGHYR